MTSSQACRIAAVQMVSGPDVAANLAEADRLIGEAAAAGAGLVVLPEYFPLISTDERAKLRICERDGEGPIQAFLKDAARRHKLWLVGGSCPLAADVPDKVRNSTLVFVDTGRRVARYDKIHLFSFQRGQESYDESRAIRPGEESPQVFDTPFGRTALGICYDLRFPEFFRAQGDVRLMVLPAAFTWTTGSVHWEVLLRARAIENQCYVLASAQGGAHANGRRTWGHSMLIDPWGEILDCLPEGPGVAAGTLDADRLEAVRESLPALRHRVL